MAYRNSLIKKAEAISETSVLIWCKYPAAMVACWLTALRISRCPNLADSSQLKTSTVSSTPLLLMVVQLCHLALPYLSLRLSACSNAEPARRFVSDLVLGNSNTCHVPILAKILRVFILCACVRALFWDFNLVCCVIVCVLCVILCVVSYCTTTATEYKPICS
jgi:hypothetical protein